MTAAPLSCVLAFDPLHAVASAGPVAWLTLAVLVVMSVATWATYGSRRVTLARLARESATAREAFLRATDTGSFARTCNDLPPGPVPRMFRAAQAEYEELVAAVGGEAASWTTVRAEAGRRLLARTLDGVRSRELVAARRGQVLLATVGATAPFVGLFGTVWGVMRAFGEIGAAGSAELTVVAPGIAEALVATAAGLVAAVPAVWFYNVLASRSRRLAIELDAFAIEFLNVYDRVVAAGGSEG